MSPRTESTPFSGLYRCKKTITIVDLQSEQKVWDLNLGNRRAGLWPFDENPDGSTNRIFAQLFRIQRLRGSSVFEKACRSSANSSLPRPNPAAMGVAEGRMGTHRSHGIGISPGPQVPLDSQHFRERPLFQYSLPALELNRAR